MKRSEIERLREVVSCQMVLEAFGFVPDIKESTTRAIKYRRDSEIIIVTHFGRGWFNPLGDGKGDIFSLVIHLEGGDFPDACERVAALVGLAFPRLILTDVDRNRVPRPPILDLWAGRSAPWPGSDAWRYLRWERRLPAFVIKTAIDQGILREGPYGSMWAGHTDDSGQICGWEGRGPEWRGFATGGAKVLFRLGRKNATRLCVTEAAIDAMSLAALEGLRDETLYLSTGGGWAPATANALHALATGAEVQLVAATDGNPQGDIFADRLRTLAEDVGCSWFRLRPSADDWNEVLKQREEEKSGSRIGTGAVPHARQPRQGRLRPAAPAPDPPDEQVGIPEGVMKD